MNTEKHLPHIRSLNGLRFILALMVFVCHWEQVVRAPGEYRVPFIHGGFPVAAFFILSGFLTGRKYTERFQVFQPAVYRRFLLSRITNGYILYVVCMIPNLVKAWTTVTDGSYRALLEKLFYNLTLTQTLFPYGTAQSISSVSWFFSCLIMMYCAFPLLAKLSLWLRNQSKYAVLAGLVICLVALHLLEPVDALYASPIFRIFQLFCGMLIAQLPSWKVSTKSKKNWLELLAVVVGILAYFRILEESITLVDTASCILLIYVLGQNWDGVISRFLGSPVMSILGNLSMPLFLIHGPVLFIWGRQLYSTITCAHRGYVTGILCFTVTVGLSVIYLLADWLIKKGVKK